MTWVKVQHRFYVGQTAPMLLPGNFRRHQNGSYPARIVGDSGADARLQQLCRQLRRFRRQCRPLRARTPLKSGTSRISTRMADRSD